MKLLELFGKLNEQPHPSQLVNVDTPQFRSWFGNSKAVDGEGHPIVFFRGTTKNPRGDVAFGTKRSIPSFVASADIASVYAASYPKTGFGPAFGEEPAPPTFQPTAQVTPVFLSIQNPVDLRGNEFINFEMDLFGIMNADWSNWDAFEMALRMLRQLSKLEAKGVQFKYELPDPPGILEAGDWDNVIQWLYDNWEEADDDGWDGHMAEQVTMVLAEIQVDAYAIVDTPIFREWASAQGFDGVVHDDVFAQGAKFAPSLLGKDRPNGLDEDDMHVTWRPFVATQVKSIYNQGGWSQEAGSKMTDSIGEAHNPKVRVKYMPRNNAYYAYLGSNRVGQAQLWDSHDDKVGKDERYVWKSAVHPNFKRQGVATALYDFMAKDLAEKGLKLVPSPDTQLSDDAYEFWKARDPESVKNHGKSKSESYKDYMGKEVKVKGRPAVVYRVGWSQSSNAPLFGIRYTDVPEGSANSQSYVGMSALHEAVEGDLPQSMEWLRNQDRYDVETIPQGERRTEYKLTAKPGKDFVPYVGREFRGEIDPRSAGWYNPKLAELEEMADDDFVRRYPRLRADSGLTQEVPATIEPGIIYRGMSTEEFQNIQRTGKVQSFGNYNLGPEQEGLTYYSTDPGSAAHYSHGFSPVEYKATPNKPAYTIGVRDPGPEHHVKVQGTGEHEVGLSQPLSLDDIVSVYQGVVYSVQSGSMEAITDIGGFRAGSSSQPDMFLGWRQIK